MAALTSMYCWVASRTVCTSLLSSSCASGCVFPCAIAKEVNAGMATSSIVRRDNFLIFGFCLFVKNHFGSLSGQFHARFSYCCTETLALSVLGDWRAVRQRTEPDILFLSVFVRYLGYN